MIAVQQKMELLMGEERTTPSGFEMFDCPKVSLLIVTDDFTGSVQAQRKPFVCHH